MRKLRIDRLKKARDFLVNEVNPENFTIIPSDKESKNFGAVSLLTTLDENFDGSKYVKFSNPEIIMYIYWASEYFGLDSNLEYFLFTSCYSHYFDYTQKQQLNHLIERLDYVIITGYAPRERIYREDLEDLGLGVLRKRLNSDKYKNNKEILRLQSESRINNLMKINDVVKDCILKINNAVNDCIFEEQKFLEGMEIKNDE